MGGLAHCFRVSVGMTTFMTMPCSGTSYRESMMSNPTGPTSPLLWKHSSSNGGLTREQFHDCGCTISCLCCSFWPGGQSRSPIHATYPQGVGCCKESADER